MGDNTRSGRDHARVRANEKTSMTDSPNPQTQQIETNEAEGLIRPEDIRSTSRSCLAIILVMVFIIVLLCIFVVVQTWIR